MAGGVDGKHLLLRYSDPSKARVTVQFHVRNRSHSRVGSTLSFMSYPAFTAPKDRPTETAIILLIPPQPAGMSANTTVSSLGLVSVCVGTDGWEVVGAQVWRTCAAPESPAQGPFGRPDAAGSKSLSRRSEDDTAPAQPRPPAASSERQRGCGPSARAP